MADNTNTEKDNSLSSVLAQYRSNATSSSMGSDVSGSGYSDTTKTDEIYTPTILGSTTPNYDYKYAMEMAFRSAGIGGFANQTQIFMSRMDRFQLDQMMSNYELPGYTFFTRPHLNLQSSSLRQSRVMAFLDTMDSSDPAFMIRCLMDPFFQLQNAEVSQTSPWLDIENALNVPLCSAVTACTGWPDPFVQTFTTAGGFFCEDQTFAIGGDRLRKTYDLNIVFKDIQYSPILKMLQVWYESIINLADGTQVAYKKFIDQHRICYTSSIYRFLLDPSKRFITHYAKATGCFPKAPPMGAIFNYNKQERASTTGGSISVPFVVNKVDYDDPIILVEFNTLMRRYCPKITELQALECIPGNNFKGLPYINTKTGNMKLEFRNHKATDAVVLDQRSLITQKGEPARIIRGIAMKNTSTSYEGDNDLQPSKYQQYREQAKPTTKYPKMAENASGRKSWNQSTVKQTGASLGLGSKTDAISAAIGKEISSKRTLN